MTPDYWLRYLRGAWDKLWSKSGGDDRACPAGSDGASLSDFDHHVDRELEDLAEELSMSLYRPFPYFEIAEPKSVGGSRTLVVLSIRDRVAAGACGRILNEMLDPTFSENSFAYRPGRSIYDAWVRIDEMRRMGLIEGFKTDISACFASISPTQVLDRVVIAGVDGSLLGAIQALLSANRTDGRQIWSGPPGLPEGLAISPVLCNFALDPIDKSLGIRGIHFVRYADDILLLAGDSAAAREAGDLLALSLSDYGLTPGAEKSGPVSFSIGFRYLGADFIDNRVLRDEMILERDATGRLCPFGAIEDEFPPPVVPEADGSAIWDEESAPVIEEGETLGDSVFLRTLYLEGYGSSLGKSGQSFVVKRDNKKVAGIPVLSLGQIILLPGAYVTTPAIHLAIKEDIPITLIGYGTFGRVESTSRDRVIRQRLQFLRAEETDFRFRFARECVRAKIANCRKLLRRRDSGVEKTDELDRLQASVEGLVAGGAGGGGGGDAAIEKLRGFEGAAAAAYFDAWPDLLLKSKFAWNGRRRRPPPDPVNAMLSFGYTLLFYNIYSMLRLHGLCPYVGHLHAIREGHPALVSDLIEEWRAPIVDTVVLRMIRQKIVAPDDFGMPEEPGGACLMGDAARRKLVDGFEKRMITMLTHPATGYRVTFRRAIDLQVRGFIRYLDGRRDWYDAFMWEG